MLVCFFVARPYDPLLESTHNFLHSITIVLSNRSEAVPLYIVQIPLQLPDYPCNKSVMVAATR